MLFGPLSVRVDCFAPQFIREHRRLHHPPEPSRFGPCFAGTPRACPSLLMKQRLWPSHILQLLFASSWVGFWRPRSSSLDRAALCTVQGVPSAFLAFTPVTARLVTSSHKPPARANVAVGYFPTLCCGFPPRARPRLFCRPGYPCWVGAWYWVLVTVGFSAFLRRLLAFARIFVKERPLVLLSVLVCCCSRAARRRLFRGARSPHSPRGAHLPTRFGSPLIWMPTTPPRVLLYAPMCFSLATVVSLFVRARSDLALVGIIFPPPVELSLYVRPVL